VDVQGPGVVTPYTQKAGVTFPVAVDTADVFGGAFRLKAIPVTYLVDEVGIIRLRGTGPAAEFLGQVEQVLKEPVGRVRGVFPAVAAAHSRSELEARIAQAPDDWQARLALAQQLDFAGRPSEAFAQCEAAAKSNSGEAAVYFTWGLVLLNQKQKQAGLSKLKQARDLAPDNWRIRKQIWAIEHPEKFYTNASPDFGWQKEELTRENSSERALNRHRGQ